MRISTTQIFRQGLAAMQDEQTRLARTQQQVSTGQRMLAPSDDPAAAKRALDLDSTLALNRQFNRNADAAVSRLGTEEISLEAATNVLLRVRELTVQGNNGAMTPEDREAIAQEVEQRLEEMLGIANGKDGNNEFIFGGYQTKTQPFSRAPSGTFVYSGDEGQRFLQVSPTFQVPIGDSGADVFQKIRVGNGTFETRDDPANAGNGVIGVGSVTDPTLYDRDTYSVQFPFSSGATVPLAFGDGGAGDTLTYTLSIDGSVVYSVDETGTPPATLADLATEINDDVGTTGVRAYVSGSTLYLGRTTASAAPVVVTEAMSGGSDGDADTVSGFFGAALSGASAPSVSTTLNSAAATDYLVVDSGGNVEAAGTYTSGSSISFNGIQFTLSGQPAPGDRFTVAPSAYRDAFSTVQSVIDALRMAGGTAADNARRANAFNRALSDLDLATERVVQVRGQVGARLNAVESEQNMNANVNVQLQETLSGLRDVDLAEAIVRLNQQLVTLQAAQQSFTQVQQLSLFNFL